MTQTACRSQTTAATEGRGKGAWVRKGGTQTDSWTLVEIMSLCLQCAEQRKTDEEKKPTKLEVSLFKMLRLMHGFSFF